MSTNEDNKGEGEGEGEGEGGWRGKVSGVEKEWKKLRSSMKKKEIDLNS